MSASLVGHPLGHLAGRHGVPTVDTETVDQFLTAQPGGTSVLFFAGDPARWPEASDVAVVLPELVAAFDGRLRPAVVAPASETALMPRFGVKTFPSLALVRGGRSLGVIAKIQDWSVYVDRIGRLLAADEQSECQGAAS